MYRSQSFGSEETNGAIVNPDAGTPALATRTSTGPKRSATAFTRSSTCARSVTSATPGIAVPPRSTIVVTVDPARSGDKSLTTTAAPCSAKRQAIPAPTPWPAPVTRATRPDRSNMVKLLRNR